MLDIHDLGLAREAGEDVVGVGSIVQRPLAAVIAQESIERPRDLEGKRVGVTGLPSDEAVLRAVVENDGGDFDQVDQVTIGFSAVPSLVSGKVDAVVTFWNAEGVALKRRDVPTTEFRVDEHGAPRLPGARAGHPRGAAPGRPRAGRTGPGHAAPTERTRWRTIPTPRSRSSPRSRAPSRS